MKTYNDYFNEIEETDDVDRLLELKDEYNSLLTRLGKMLEAARLLHDELYSMHSSLRGYNGDDGIEFDVRVRIGEIVEKQRNQKEADE